MRGWLRAYIFLVITAGLGLLAWFFAHIDWPETTHEPLLWLLLALVVVGELFPIRVPFRDGTQDITVSTTFVFALLLVAGPAVAGPAQAVGATVSDAVSRKAWWKILFNATQYTLAVGASGATLAVLGYTPLRGMNTWHPRDMLVMLVAGIVFYVANNVLVGIAVSMAQGSSPLDFLRDDLLFQVGTSLVLLSQAPLVLLVGEGALWLVPLFFPAVAAAYRGANASAEREHHARYDALTGLPNRAEFHARVTRALRDSPDEGWAVLLIDLDRFRDVNDTLGHAVGDGVLRQVAARLVDTLGDGFVVAHLGGDEFGVLASTDRNGADALVERLQQALSVPIDLDGLPFGVAISVGGAFAPEHGTESGTLMQHADVALNIAKDRHAGYVAYSRSLDNSDPRRLTLVGELRHAIESGHLTVHYQPKALVATGEVVGAEALVRWDHPEHGLLAPDVFIPLAEATGLIGPLTLFVARQALAQCRAWREQGLDLVVSVNVSPRSLHDVLLPEQFSALLVEHRLPAEVLQIELTESGTMDDPQLAQELLGRIHDLGTSVALDDFGTGHSSLAYVKRLPVDVIKVDKSFVIGMLTDEDSATIVESTIALGHSLGLEVVAEGVESEDAWRALATYGCDVVQGYYLSRPLPADKITAWLLASQRPVARLSSRPGLDSALRRP